MQTGWFEEYYLDPDGRMKTGWLQLDGAWYYLNKESGAKTKGWKEIENVWYYFEADGKMIAGQVKNIDGTDYQFNADGAWVEETAAEEQTTAEQTP